jgi:hypothetical protein
MYLEKVETGLDWLKSVLMQAGTQTVAGTPPTNPPATNQRKLSVGG